MNTSTAKGNPNKKYKHIDKVLFYIHNDSYQMYLRCGRKDIEMRINIISFVDEMVLLRRHVHSSHGLPAFRGNNFKFLAYPDFIID